MDILKGQDLSGEEWREYAFEGTVYRIKDPVALWVGNTTHRVLDAKGIVHCIPAVGFKGCVLRWKPRNLMFPVKS